MIRDNLVLRVVNKPEHDERMPMLHPKERVMTMEEWITKKFGERYLKWGVNTYKTALGMAHPSAPNGESDDVWHKFLFLDQLGDDELIALFPRQSDRRSLIENARKQKEEIFKECFAIDYVLLSDEEKRRHPTPQDYWEARWDIIKDEYKKACKHYSKLSVIRAPSLEEFTRGYFSRLVDTFIPNVLNSFSSDLNIDDLQLRYKGGHREHLKKHRWSINKVYISPEGTGGPDTLLVNVIDKDSLSLALATGRLGRAGKGRACFSEDRVCYSRGYALVFRLSELAQVYPMYRFDECPFDAHLLKEWRSPIAADMNLAIALIPTTETYFGQIPEGKAYGTRVFGEEVLIKLKECA